MLKRDTKSKQQLVPRDSVRENSPLSYHMFTSIAHFVSTHERDNINMI